MLDILQGSVMLSILLLSGVLGLRSQAEGFFRLKP